MSDPIPSPPDTPPWEPWGTQMMLLAFSGAPASQVLQTVRRQGFFREPAVVQFRALQMAGFRLEDLLPFAGDMAPVLGAIVRTLHADGALDLHFGPNEVNRLGTFREEPGFSAAERFRFFMQAFPAHERLLVGLASLLCQWDPSKVLAALLRDCGIDPHSMLLRARTATQAERLQRSLGLPRWFSLGIPEWPVIPGTDRVYRRRRVPPDTLALLAVGDLTFEACRFAAPAPPIQAETLEIRDCPTLRRLGPLDVASLHLTANPALEALPDGLCLRGSLQVHDCPRLRMPRRLVVEGDLVLGGPNARHSLPSDAAVGGRVFLHPPLPA